MVLIDYLQLLTSGKRVESRQQGVSEFSRAPNLMAKELQVPVIALSHLNRGAEQRAAEKPALSDLRESGSIEQDADSMPSPRLEQCLRRALGNRNVIIGALAATPANYDCRRGGLRSIVGTESPSTPRFASMSTMSS
ncbi:hypothetical protein MMX123_00444 [Microbacterium sp. MM2322]